MAELINLRTARKQKQRGDAELKALENRAKFGRTKVEKQLSETKVARAAAKLDGHKRQD